MKVKWLLGLVVMVNSCGLETVATLTAPNVNFLDQTLVTNTALSMHYIGPSDSTIDFQGYQVYYKIYPGKTFDFSRLIADRDSVNLSPTVNQLLNLGYFQMTQSSSSNTANATALAPLLLHVSSGTPLITLDFSNYSANSQPTAGNQYNQPILEYDGISSNAYLFRTSLLAGNPLESFVTLATWSPGQTAATMDMAGLDPTGNHYEINVFLIAYALSSTLQAIYSSPVPWGVIRSPNP